MALTILYVARNLAEFRALLWQQVSNEGNNGKEFLCEHG